MSLPALQEELKTGKGLLFADVVSALGEGQHKPTEPSYPTKMKTLRFLLPFTPFSFLQELQQLKSQKVGPWENGEESEETLQKVQVRERGIFGRRREGRHSPVRRRHLLLLPPNVHFSQLG